MLLVMVSPPLPKRRKEQMSNCKICQYESKNGHALDCPKRVKRSYKETLELVERVAKRESGSTECGDSCHTNDNPVHCQSCKPASPEWEKYVKTWSEQGRTEEQIYAVRNFMTGQGFIMLKDFKQSLHSLILKGMPEKYDSDPYGVMDDRELKRIQEAKIRNKTLDDVTEALSEIFEGKDGEIK